jgi:hypothetical protein
MAGMYEVTQVGKRQELTDKIFNVEADATPFLSLIKRGGKPNQMVATWQAEAYPAVAAAGILDGTDVSAFDSVARELLEGVCQWFRQPWMVSKLANLTAVAGVGRNEAAHQAMLASMLLKRRLEIRMLSDAECSVESGQTPYAMRGAFKGLLDTAQAVKPVPASFRPAAACAHTSALSGLTESAFRDMLESAYSAKREPVDLDGFVGVDLKALFDDFSYIYPAASTSSQPVRKFDQGDGSQIRNAVDVLRFSTGTVRLHLSSFLKYDVSTGAASAYSPKSGLFLDLAMWELAFMQNPAIETLQDDGGGPRGYVDAVAVLKCLNPLGQLRVETNS